MHPWGLLSQTHQEFCVLVQLVLHITYYPEDQIQTLFGHLEGDSPYFKREPRSLTQALILGGGLAGAGTGVTALALQSKKKKDNSLKDGLNHGLIVLPG